MSGEHIDERWRPILGIDAILTSVLNMLNEPNCDSPANVDAGVMYYHQNFIFVDII